MANLTQNLELLREGKQKVIDAVKTKLKEDPGLNIDSTWTAIEAAIESIVVKADPTIDPDASQDLTRLCDRQIDYVIKVESLNIPQYIFYNQTQLPMVKAPFAKTIEQYAFYGNTSLYHLDLPQVQSIGSYAFYNNKALEELDLPMCTTINAYAFSGDTLLETLHTPKLNIVYGYTFDGCSKLTNIDLEEVTTISGDYSFRNTALVDVSLPKLTSIGSNVFYNCSKLETLTLDKITSLSSNYLAYNCPKLTDISMPNLTSRTYNGTTSLIATCSSLNRLYLPKLASSSGFLISDCNTLTDLSLPSLTTLTIDYYSGRLVSSMSSLTKISLPLLRQFGSCNNSDYLISNCQNLATLELPSLAYCGASQSSSSTSPYRTSYGNLISTCGMTSLNLPSLQFITTYYSHTLLNNCKNLTEAKFPGLTSMYGGSAYTDNNSAATIISGSPKLTSIKLDSLSTWRGSTMFRPYSTSLQYYSPDYCDACVRSAKRTYGSTNQNYYNYYKDYYQYVHGTVSSWKNNIEPAVEPNVWGNANYASYCGLKTIELPKLSYFCNSPGTYRYLFYYLSQLETISLGDGTFTPITTYLPRAMCQSCHKLTSVILNYPIVMQAPWALTSIFVDCPHLTGTTLTTYIGSSSSIEPYANAAGLKDLYFYVPDNLVADYKAASNWSTYADQIKPMSALAALIIDSAITEITDNEFENRTDLTSVSGAGVTKIGSYAFANTSADTLAFPSTNVIGEYAFKDSTNLSALSLYVDGITEIGEGAFMNTALVSYPLNSLDIVPKYLFKDTTSLKTVSVNNATIISEEAFSNTGLTSFTANKVYKVNKAAFKNCADLTSLTLNVATTIGQEAFMGSGLASVSLPLVTTVKTAAFKDCKLTSVVLPKITLIEDHAFANNTSLASINLYDVLRVGDGAFEGCTALKNIYFRGFAVPECINISKDITWHVRFSMLDEFKEQYPEYTIVGDVV